MYAQLDFRQADPCGPVIAHYPVAAGQRQLHAAPQTEALNHGNSDAGQAFDFIHHLMAAIDHGNGIIVIIYMGKFIDVSTGNKTAFFVADKHYASGQRLGLLVENLAQLIQHRGG